MGLQKKDNFTKDIGEMIRVYINHVDDHTQSIYVFDKQLKALMEVVNQEFMNNGCTLEEYNHCIKMFEFAEQLIGGYVYDKKGFKI